MTSLQDKPIASKAKQEFNIRDDNASMNISDNSEDEGWMDVDAADDEAEKVPIVSLVDAKIFDNANDMLAYCKERANLDFIQIRNQLGLDFLGCIKLTNFIRAKVRDGEVVPLDIKINDLESEDLMIPVLPEDGFIMSLDDLPELEEQLVDLQQPSEVVELKRKNAKIVEDLRNMEQQFQMYRKSVAETLDQRWGVAGDGVSTPQPVPTNTSEPFLTDGLKEPSMKEIMKKEIEEEESNENDYFDSYAGLEIHETMLKDAIRTESYRDFIYNNKNLFADKTILDVGCGTGILSMFCAKAGAKRVIAVDNSDVVKMAQQNVVRNGLEKIIVVLQGKIEEVILPVHTVDVIVSEWMGYCLTYEAMLPSVLWARDRYLVPDGLMVPSHATLRLAPVAGTKYVEDGIYWWRDVYGFNMGPLADIRKQHVTITSLEKGDIAGDAVPFRIFDLHAVKVPELEFVSNFETRLERGIDAFEGWAIWFDIFFTRSRQEVVNPEDTPETWITKGSDRVAFTTGPEGKLTHWEQGLAITKDLVAKEYQEGDDFIGTIEFKHMQTNKRHLKIRIAWETRVQEKKDQTWLLG